MAHKPQVTVNGDKVSMTGPTAFGEFHLEMTTEEARQLLDWLDNNGEMMLRGKVHNPDRGKTASS
jgi:hypothetical protein